MSTLPIFSRTFEKLVAFPRDVNCVKRDDGDDDAHHDAVRQLDAVVRHDRVTRYDGNDEHRRDRLQERRLEVASPGDESRDEADRQNLKNLEERQGSSFNHSKHT